MDYTIIYKNHININKRQQVNYLNIESENLKQKIIELHTFLADYHAYYLKLGNIHFEYFMEKLFLTYIKILKIFIQIQELTLTKS